METLKTAAFGTLFQVTFMVAATFQAAAGLLGLVMAVLAPGGFTMNGEPAANVGEAVVAVIVMLVAFLLCNLAISAGGAGLWLVVRRFLFKARPQAEVF